MSKKPPPPPPPIRNPLTVTQKMLRSTLFEKGLTGSLSADLTAVCGALRVLEGQKPQRELDARDLSAAFNRWLNGDHPGELSLLKSTPVFNKIQAFVAAYPVRIPPPAARRVTSPSTLKSVGVGLYTAANLGQNFKLSIPERQRKMRAAVKQFHQWMETVNPADFQADNAFKGIFVAPEYYFTKPSRAGNREFLDLATKNRIEQDLIKLSRDFPKILLVPGTIHYDVQITQLQKEATGYQLLQAAKDRILREKALADPGKVLAHTMSRNPSGTLSKVPSMNEMATALLDKSTTLRKIHNVTSLILAGKVWGSYDKHSDYFEAKSISPNQSMFVPGTQDECPEIGDVVRKFKFGVEICFDHANSVLKRRSPMNLHFHIVVSDWAKNNTGNMAMGNGGYFLHASTNHDETVLYRRHDDGKLVNETKTLLKKRYPWGFDCLETFLIQLPRPLPPPPPPRPPRI